MEEVTILIVEDDPAILSGIKAAVADESWNIETAENGKEAIEHIREKKPNLVLLDIMMPKMDGIEFLESVKGDKILDGVPIVVLTNLGSDDDKENALKLGAKDYIVKADLDVDTIPETIKSYLS